MSKNLDFKKQIEKTEKVVFWFSITGMSAAIALIISILMK